MSHPPPTMGRMADVKLFKDSESLSSTITHASLSNDEWASADSPGTTPSMTAAHDHIRLVSQYDDDYPARLRSIEFPPGHLWRHRGSRRVRARPNRNRRQPNTQ